jgi:hypothetical protein
LNISNDADGRPVHQPRVSACLVLEDTQQWTADSGGLVQPDGPQRRFDRRRPHIISVGKGGDEGCDRRRAERRQRRSRGAGFCLRHLLAEQLHQESLHAGSVGQLAVAAAQTHPHRVGEIQTDDGEQDRRDCPNPGRPVDPLLRLGLFEFDGRIDLVRSAGVSFTSIDTEILPLYSVRLSQRAHGDHATDDDRRAAESRWRSST